MVIPSMFSVEAEKEFLYQDSPQRSGWSEERKAKRRVESIS